MVEELIESTDSYEPGDLAGTPRVTHVIRKLGEKYLRENGATSPETAIRPRQIVNWLTENYAHLQLKPNTIWAQLSWSPRDPSSPVTNAGRGKGYYISDTAERIADETSDMREDLPAATRIEREKLFYPSAQQWLNGQNYRSADTSGGRRHGRWGNPDITGIRGVEHFGVVHVEVATIEVKPSIDGWEYWIFEAVSHRRFANRAYFAFAHPWDLIEKIPDEMRYFAELYQIGILILGTDDEVYDHVMKGSSPREIEPDEIEIIEKYPAPRTTLLPEYQQGYLEALGINNQQQLWGWGSDSGA